MTVTAPGRIVFLIDKDGEDQPEAKADERSESSKNIPVDNCMHYQICRQVNGCPESHVSGQAVDHVVDCSLNHEVAVDSGGYTYCRSQCCFGSEANGHTARHTVEYRNNYTEGCAKPHTGSSKSPPEWNAKQALSHSDHKRAQWCCNDQPCCESKQQ